MLDAYLERIGFHGDPAGDLPTLVRLQRQHLAAIPFEAIDVIAGVPVDLAIPAVVDKLVTRRRGGYCFEQNILFEQALRIIGFDVSRALARVLWHRPVNAPRPARSHLALIVSLGGANWLVDVGFGGTVPDQPLLLDSTAPQKTRHDLYRIVDGFEGKLLTVMRDGVWRQAYELAPGRIEDADLVMANWYTSSHPSSPFRVALAVSRCTNEARYGLYGRNFSVRRADGDVIQRQLDHEELRQVLLNEFGLPANLPAFVSPASQTGFSSTAARRGVRFKIRPKKNLHE